MTGNHYSFVSEVYNHFRILLASQNLTSKQMQLLTTVETISHTVHENIVCRHCKSNTHCKGREEGVGPILGVTILESGCIALNPLETDKQNHLSDYAGIICKGKVHSFVQNKKPKAVIAHLWSWMHERLQVHHGIHKRNIGLYLKELEWKYNNRNLSQEEQALKIVELLPPGFLVPWANLNKFNLDLVQKHS